MWSHKTVTLPISYKIFSIEQKKMGSYYTQNSLTEHERMCSSELMNRYSLANHFNSQSLQ